VSRSVAILGPQGAGKSSIAALFEEHRGYRRHGIADAIKRVAADSYPAVGKDDLVTVHRYDGIRQISGRELLQDIGAAMREGVDINYWLRAWELQYLEIIEHGQSVVVDDVRLPNEVTFLKERCRGRVDDSIFIVRLTADHEVRERRMGGQLLGTKDITEVGWTAAEFHLTVDTSDITPEEAYRQITDAMEEVQ